MTYLTQSEGSVAFERFCINRKLKKEKTSTVYEFAAFIDYGISTIRNNMKKPDAIEVPVSAHTKHQINLLNSDHGEMLLKAMVIRKYGGCRWLLLKAKKYFYINAAWCFGVYYDTLDRFW